MKTGDPLAAARRVIGEAVEARVFPAAVAEVGDSAGVLWREPFGALTFDADATATGDDTVFDLASITKPIATTSVILHLVAERQLSLQELVSSSVPEWSGPGRTEASLEDLLEHASGLPARLFDPPPRSRREFEHEICTLPLEYGWRSRTVYSDLGFILLGFIAADRGAATLDAQFAWVVERVRGVVGLAVSDVLGYGAPADARLRVAPTDPLPDDPRRGRKLRGDAHDHYAAALGGVAGHAGLFATAGGLGTFARAVLRSARGDLSIPEPLSPARVDRAIRRSTVAGSSRALGWDTMRPTSSCGTALSPAAFGHVGFTGTSLWIDPILDRYFVLLTNRVCGGGTSDDMQAVRRSFHDVVAQI